jgi:hypothetical protein
MVNVDKKYGRGIILNFLEGHDGNLKNQTAHQNVRV